MLVMMLINVSQVHAEDLTYTQNFQNDTRRYLGSLHQLACILPRWITGTLKRQLLILIIKYLN